MYLCWWYVEVGGWWSLALLLASDLVSASDSGCTHPGGVEQLSCVVLLSMPAGQVCRHCQERLQRRRAGQKVLDLMPRLAPGVTKVQRGMQLERSVKPRAHTHTHTHAQ